MTVCVTVVTVWFFFTVFYVAVSIIKKVGVTVVTVFASYTPFFFTHCYGICRTVSTVFYGVTPVYTQEIVKNRHNRHKPSPTGAQTVTLSVTFLLKTVTVRAKIDW